MSTNAWISTRIRSGHSESNPRNRPTIVASTKEVLPPVPAARIEEVALQVACPAFGHLATAGVSGAEEQNRQLKHWHRHSFVGSTFNGVVRFRVSVLGGQSRKTAWGSGLAKVWILSMSDARHDKPARLMTPETLERLKKRLEAMLVELSEVVEDRTGSTAPVQLDGSIGRLSRMDAIEL